MLANLLVRGLLPLCWCFSRLHLFNKILDPDKTFESKYLASNWVEPFYGNTLDVRWEGLVKVFQFSAWFRSELDEFRYRGLVVNTALVDPENLVLIQALT